MGLVVPRSLFFVNSRFNDVDASFSIIFNFVACPAFSNVYYKISYARNISASLLVLMGFTKIEFLSYAYNINMYCIIQSLVNGNLPVNFVYTFPISGSDRLIASNTEFVFSSLRGKICFHIQC